MKHIQRFLTALKTSRILGSSTLRKLFLAQNISCMALFKGRCLWICASLQKKKIIISPVLIGMKSPIIFCQERQMLLCFIFHTFFFYKSTKQKELWNQRVQEIPSWLETQTRNPSVARKLPVENGNTSKIMLGLQMRSKVMLKRELLV